MRPKSIQLAAAAALVAVLLTSGCVTQAGSGALIGSLVGAGLGQAIGGDTEATLIGTAVGAGAGYIIGNEQDKLDAQAPAAPAATTTVVKKVYVTEPVYVPQPIVVEPVRTNFVIVYDSHHRPRPRYIHRHPRPHPRHRH